MAFCTNCGKSLGEQARFCTNCGTPAMAAAAPTTSPSVTVVPVPMAAPATGTAVRAEIPAPQQPAQTPASEIPVPSLDLAPSEELPAPAPYNSPSIAPPSSGSPVFMIVCAVLVLLILGGIAGTVYLQRQGKARRAAQQQSQPVEPSPETSTNSSAVAPVGTTEPSSASAMPKPVNSSSAAGTPFPTPAAAPAVADSVRAMNLGNYPGATPVAIAILSGETVVAGFLTRDTPQQVMQFYKIRFPASIMTDSEGKAELSATLPGGERIRIQAQPQGTNTQVMVLQEK